MVPSLYSNEQVRAGCSGVPLWSMQAGAEEMEYAKTVIIECSGIKELITS